MPDVLRACTCCIVLVGIGPAMGQEIFELLSPQVGEAPARAGYETLYAPERAAGRRDLAMFRQNLHLAIPVFQTDQHEWTLLAGVRHVALDTDARLPRSGDELPASLWDVRVGAGYRRRFDTGVVAGASATFGSVSDHPFASAAEWVVDANGFVRLPAGAGDDAWVAFLNFATNRAFLPNVPLPGGGYLWAPDKRLSLLAGFPLSSLRWEALDWLTLEGTYVFPRDIHARVTFHLCRPVALYLGYDWTSQSFLRHDRADRDHRLFYYEQRLLAGLRWDILENLWLDLGAGFAFERFFFEADEYDDRYENRIDLEDGPFVRLQLGVRL